MRAIYFSDFRAISQLNFLTGETRCECCDLV